jgi:hypothetical protein
MDFFRTTHLTPATATAYNNKINKWISLLPPHKNTLLYIFFHPNFSVVTLREFLSKNNTDTAPTLNSYIKAVLSASEHNPELFDSIDNDDYTKSENRWKELRQKTYEHANQYRMQQKPSPSQSLKSGSSLVFTDIIKVRDKLEDGSIDKLLLSFYTYIPPVRADFFATQVLNYGQEPSYPNYILYNSDKAHMTLTDFKTAPIYKSIQYELPSELHRQLVLSLTNNPRTFLFELKPGIAFNRKTFSEWATKKLTTIFKKEFTLTMFRHIFISNLDANSSPEILYDISRKMGHSITQQMLYRWKEHGEDSE